MIPPWQSLIAAVRRHHTCLRDTMEHFQPLEGGPPRTGLNDLRSMPPLTAFFLPALPPSIYLSFTRGGRRRWPRTKRRSPAYYGHLGRILSYQQTLSVVTASRSARLPCALRSRDPALQTTYDASRPLPQARYTRVIRVQSATPGNQSMRKHGSRGHRVHEYFHLF